MATEQEKFNANVGRTYSGIDWKALSTGPVTPTPRSVYVGSGGSLIVTGSDGVGAVFTNVASGSVLPLRVTEINAASTASDIVGIY